MLNARMLAEFLFLSIRSARSHAPKNLHLHRNNSVCAGLAHGDDTLEMVADRHHYFLLSVSHDCNLQKLTDRPCCGNCSPNYRKFTSPASRG